MATSSSKRLHTDVGAVRGPALAMSATVQPTLRDSEVQQVRADDELLAERMVH